MSYQKICVSVFLFACLFFTCAFAAGSFNPKNTLFWGQGLSSGNVGSPNFFFIQPRDSSNNNVTDCSLTFVTTIQFQTITVPATISCAVTGLYTVIYTPKTAATYAVDIAYNNTVLSTNNVLINPGPISASNTIATGPGLKGGVVGPTKQYFYLTTYDVYQNHNYSCAPIFNVALTGAANVTGQAAGCNTTSGQYTFYYTTLVSGLYDLNVILSNSPTNSYPVKNSPFHATMLPGNFSASQSVLSGPGISSAVAGSLAAFFIDAQDQYGNDITSCLPTSQWSNFDINLTPQGGNATRLTIASCNINGIYTVTYNVTVATTYTLTVTYNGIALKNSGLTVIVTAASLLSPAKSIASGPGLKGGNAGQSAQFGIQSFDIYGNQINECLNSVNSADWTISLVATYSVSTRCVGNVTNCVYGNYLAQYVCDASTNYKLEVAYLGTPITGSPFTKVYIEPGAIWGPATNASGPGLTQAQAGVAATFLLSAWDQYGNKITVCEEPLNPTFTISVVANSGQSSEGWITGCEPGTGNYTGAYTVTTANILYSLAISYQSNQVQNSPFIIKATPGPPSPTNCTYGGPGINGAVAGTKGVFWAVCTDFYGNEIVTCPASSDWNVTMNNQLNNNVYVWASVASCDDTVIPVNTTFTYNATVSGPYTADVTFSEYANLTHTFYPVIIPGPFDSGNSIAVGDGVDRRDIPAGNNATFAIISRDYWGNNVTTCINSADISLNVYGPNGFHVVPPVTECDPATGQIYSWWNNTAAGNYSVTIVYKSVPIKDSPYSPAVVAGPVAAPKTVVTGQGTIGGTAGEIAPIYIYTYDEYGNAVTYCNSYSVENWNIILSGPAPIGGAVHNCSLVSGIAVLYGDYLPYKAGTYSLTVSFNNENVPHSFTPLIVANVVNDSISAAQGPGVGQDGPLYAGSSQQVFTITSYDAWGNNNYTCLSGPKSVVVTATEIMEERSHELKASLPNIADSGKASKLSKEEVDDSAPRYISRSISSYDATLINSTHFVTTLIFPNGTHHNSTVSSSFCYNGTYTVTYNMTSPIGEYGVIVQGASTKENVKYTPASITLLAADLYGPNFIYNYSTAQDFTIGNVIELYVSGRDIYKNFNSTCIPIIPSDWNVTASGGMLQQTFFGTVNHCSAGVYYVTFIVLTKGTYSINIQYQNHHIQQVPFSLTFGVGVPSAKYSYAAGHGVTDSEYNVAGNWTFFEILVANQYGLRVTDPTICENLSPLNFTINFKKPIIWNFDSYFPYVVSGCTTNATYPVQYNATIAQVDLPITIMLNNNTIIGDDYLATIYPGPIDMAKTKLTGLNHFSTDNGTFYVNAYDWWGNEENFGKHSGLDVSFSPQCVTNPVYVWCSPAPLGLACNYSAPTGGEYCLELTYKGIEIPLPNTRIQISGGTLCTDGCNQNGFCLEQNSNSTNTTYACNCIQNYAGDSCQYKISSHYLVMGLAIGLIIGISLLMLILGLIFGTFVIAKALNRNHHHHRDPLLER